VNEAASEPRLYFWQARKLSPLIPVNDQRAQLRQGFRYLLASSEGYRDWLFH